MHATVTQCNFYDHFCNITASFYDYDSKTKLINGVGAWNSKDASILNKTHLLKTSAKDH